MTNDTPRPRRVMILAGMREFIGCTGTVVAKEGPMLRVKLDKPVEIPGVGTVTDDTWAPSGVRTIRTRNT